MLSTGLDCCRCRVNFACFLESKLMRIVTIALRICELYNPKRPWGQVTVASGENSISLNALGSKSESTGKQPPPDSLKHDAILGEVQHQNQRKAVDRHRMPANFDPTGLAVDTSVLKVPEPASAEASSDAVSKGHDTYSLSDILHREGYVLSGAKETGAGIKTAAHEAAKNWPLTAVEVAGGLVIGSAMVLASRNPELAVPVRVINRTMMAVAGADLASRVAVPSYNAIVHPALADTERAMVGKNLGDAVFNYGMAVVAGGFGSRFSASLLERTALGAKIQGYEYLRTPGGAELRLFNSGNALVTRNGKRVFEQAASNLDEQLNPVGHADSTPDKTIVGDNDKLRETFGESPKVLPNWRAGKDIAESAGKFDDWYETITSALATEFTERTADIGIGLIEHAYIQHLHPENGNGSQEK